MINILWADDQVDIVNTFRPVLDSLPSKITIVQNGEEVIRKVKKNYYDLLLLDLKMPPEEWGGLWVLEELRKFNQKLPVVIISGEGTQNETIKALRMGAQDYVTKDKVQAELLQRVKMVLKDVETKLANDLTNSLPTFLALHYKRYLNALESTTRLHRLLEFYETYLRFCCIVGVCETRQNKYSYHTLDDYKPLIQAPSMGVWNQSRHLFSKHAPNHSVFSKLNSIIDTDFSASLVKVRNDIAHGAEPSEKSALEYLSNFENGIQGFTKRLWHNLSFEIIVPERFQFDGTSFEVDGVSVSGSDTALPKMKIKVSIPLISGHSYLSERSEGEWISLHPFLILEPSNEPAAWKVMMYDSVRLDRNVKSITGNETIRYTDISSGQRNVIPSSGVTSKTLPTFMTGL